MRLIKDVFLISYIMYFERIVVLYTFFIFLYLNYFSNDIIAKFAEEKLCVCITGTRFAVKLIRHVNLKCSRRTTLSEKTPWAHFVDIGLVQ